MSLTAIADVIIQWKSANNGQYPSFNDLLAKLGGDSNDLKETLDDAEKVQAIYEPLPGRYDIVPGMI